MPLFYTEPLLDFTKDIFFIYHFVLNMNKILQYCILSIIFFIRLLGIEHNNFKIWNVLEFWILSLIMLEIISSVQCMF